MTHATRSELDDLILASTPGNFPWDQWKAKALAAGLSAELADLGRAVMRESYQHDWCESLKYECGLHNEGTAQGMIDCAQDEPDLTTDRWQWLLATDGLRSDPWERESFSELAIEWTAMRQRWDAERSTSAVPFSSLALKRQAHRFIEEFFDLDQLAIIDLLNHAFSSTMKEKAVLWADFTVIEHDPVYPRIRHSGVVRIENDGQLGYEGAIFKRQEEAENED